MLSAFTQLLITQSLRMCDTFPMQGSTNNPTVNGCCFFRSPCHGSKTPQPHQFQSVYFYYADGTESAPNPEDIAGGAGSTEVFPSHLMI